MKSAQSYLIPQYQYSPVPIASIRTPSIKSYKDEESTALSFREYAILFLGIIVILCQIPFFYVYGLSIYECSSDVITTAMTFNCFCQCFIVLSSPIWEIVDVVMILTSFRNSTLFEAARKYFKISFYSHIGIGLLITIYGMATQLTNETILSLRELLLGIAPYLVFMITALYLNGGDLGLPWSLKWSLLGLGLSEIAFQCVNGLFLVIWMGEELEKDNYQEFNWMTEGFIGLVLWFICGSKIIDGLIVICSAFSSYSLKYFQLSVLKSTAMNIIASILALGLYPFLINFFAESTKIIGIFLLDVIIFSLMMGFFLNQDPDTIINSTDTSNEED